MQKIKHVLLLAALLALNPFNATAQDINLRIYYWEPPNFPITNALLTWDGPCGDYLVWTNSDLNTTNWGVYDSVQKLYYLNVPLVSVFTIDEEAPQMFFKLSFNEAPFQEQCQETQVQIFVQPQDTTANTNETVRLETYAAGPEGMTYTWNKDGQEISWATSRILTIPNVVPADAGDYYVTVESPLGQKRISDTATLTVVEQESLAPMSMPLSEPALTSNEKQLLGVFDPHAAITPEPINRKNFEKILRELERSLK